MSEYIIKKGKHKSKTWPVFWRKKYKFLWELSFLDPYDIGIYQSDWNTAAGISFGLFGSSCIKLGWRYVPKEKGYELAILTRFFYESPVDNSFESYPSRWETGVLLYPYKVRSNRQVLLNINYSKETKEYIVKLRGNGYKIHEYKLKALPAPKFGTYDYPFFGDYYSNYQKAPHDIRVKQIQLI